MHARWSEMRAAVDAHARAAARWSQPPRRRYTGSGTRKTARARRRHRLTSPTPLVHIQDWARTWAVPEILGIPAVRSMMTSSAAHAGCDRPVPGADHLQDRGPGAIIEFGIDIGQLHWDMTSFSLHGAYDDADEDYPGPSYGHSKDRRDDLLQIQAGIAAAGDGGILLYHRAYDGGAAAAAGTAGRRPDPPAMTPKPVPTEVDLHRCATYRASCSLGVGTVHIPRYRSSMLVRKRVTTS